jgi:hypothetical protein
MRNDLLSVSLRPRVTLWEAQSSIVYTGCSTRLVYLLLCGIYQCLLQNIHDTLVEQDRIF